MKVILSLALALAALPVWAAGPTQGPIQGPMQAPNKSAMNGQAPSVAQRSSDRRAYSYEPGDVADSRSYSYAPSYSTARRYSPQVFTRIETVKTAAFKSVQQYAD